MEITDGIALKKLGKEMKIAKIYQYCSKNEINVLKLYYKYWIRLLSGKNLNLEFVVYFAVCFMPATSIFLAKIDQVSADENMQRQVSVSGVCLKMEFSIVSSLLLSLSLSPSLSLSCF